MKSPCSLINEFFDAIGRAWKWQPIYMFALLWMSWIPPFQQITLTFRKTAGKSWYDEQYHVPTTVEGRRHHGYASIYGSISVQNQNNDHFCLTNANICTHYFMPSNIKKQQRQPKFNMIHRNEIVIAFALWMLLYCWRMHAVLICGHHHKSIKLNELFYHIIYAKKVNPNASHRQTQAGSFIVFKNGWYCSGHFRRHPPLCASFHSNSLHKYLRSTLK